MEKLKNEIKLDKADTPGWFVILMLVAVFSIAMFVIFWVDCIKERANQEESYPQIMSTAKKFQEKYNIEGELNCYVRDSQYWYADCTIWREAKWPYEMFCTKSGCRCVNRSRYDEERPGSCSEGLEQVSRQE